jgi:invasion protein IalB
MNPMAACAAAVILVSFLTHVAPASAQTANNGTTSTGNADTVAADRKSCELAAAKWKEKDKFIEWCEAEENEIPVTQIKTDPPGPETMAANGSSARSGPSSSASNGEATWIRLCSNSEGKEICQVNHEQIDLNSGMSILSLGVGKLEGKEKEQLTVTLPQTTVQMAPAGLHVTVDNGEPVFLAYIDCDATSCTAAADLTHELLNKLRSGKQLFVSLISPQAPYRLPVNLIGFTKAYDGPSTDAAEYVEVRNRAIAALRQRQAASQGKDSQASPPMGESPSPSNIAASGQAPSSQPQPVYPNGPPPGVQP